MAKSTKKKPQPKPKLKKVRKPGKRAVVAPDAAEVPRPPPPLAIGQPASVLDRLWSVVVSRRTANPAASHSARLCRAAPPRWRRNSARSLSSA